MSYRHIVITIFLLTILNYGSVFSLSVESNYSNDSNDLDLFLMNSILVANEFKVLKKIGGGSYGSVYSGISVVNSRKVAIKVENLDSSYPMLREEYHKYVLVNNSEYFPEVLWMGRYSNYQVMVMEQLGMSLDGYTHKSHHKRPLDDKMISRIGEQMLLAIETLHRKSLLHRDIKPNNILLSPNENITNDRVYLIDLGSADFFCYGSVEKNECRNPFEKQNRSYKPLTRYQYHSQFQHVEYQDGLEFTGTPRYASLNALHGIQMSRRDDLESLGYSLVYLYRDLPWQGVLQVTNTYKMILMIKTAKDQTSLQELCFGLPDVLLLYFQYVKGLGFYEEPNYTFLRDLMIRLRTED